MDCVKQIKLLMILLLLLFNMQISWAENWDFTQEVAYQENHDPSVIWLVDGTKITVQYIQIQWEEVSKWPKGKKLAISYNPQAGAVLLDPKSGKFIPIMQGLAKHPIEMMMESCLSRNVTTVDISDCYLKARESWDRELNRVYALNQARLKDTAKKELKATQQEWIKFRNSAEKTIQAVYAEREGSIWGNITSEKIMEITKEQAVRLNSLLE